jgi:hypothetical protein
MKAALTSGWKRELSPGQVSGNFVAWWKETLTSEDVFVYDIVAGTTTQIPDPNHKNQWGSSVTARGPPTTDEAAMAAGCPPSS